MVINKVMNIGGKHTNAVESRMMIRRITLDYYGDSLLKIGFSYKINLDDEMRIIRIPDQIRTKAFEGTFSVS